MRTLDATSCTVTQLWCTKKKQKKQHWAFTSMRGDWRCYALRHTQALSNFLTALFTHIWPFTGFLETSRLTYPGLILYSEVDFFVIEINKVFSFYVFNFDVLNYNFISASTQFFFLFYISIIATHLLVPIWKSIVVFRKLLFWPIFNKTFIHMKFEENNQWRGGVKWWVLHFYTIAS